MPKEPTRFLFIRKGALNVPVEDMMRVLDTHMRHGHPIMPNFEDEGKEINMTPPLLHDGVFKGPLHIGKLYNR